MRHRRLFTPREIAAAKELRACIRRADAYWVPEAQLDAVRAMTAGEQLRGTSFSGTEPRAVLITVSESTDLADPRHKLPCGLWALDPDAVRAAEFTWGVRDVVSYTGWRERTVRDLARKGVAPALYAEPPSGNNCGCQWLFRPVDVRAFAWDGTLLVFREAVAGSRPTALRMRDGTVFRTAMPADILPVSQRVYEHMG